LVKHWTHEEFVTLHRGVWLEQSAFEVHPARQVKSLGWQMGAAVPQS
jgi:hypothetical protein